ncbi:hypothetical protein NXS19_002799 [Fusarium pseudograminearum]|nr:hypothetical protein NXS19_002799 [Fusarium pseudograminearum]
MGIPILYLFSHTSMWQDLELPSHFYIFIWHVPAPRKTGELSRRCPIFYGNVFVLWFDDEKHRLLELIQQHLDRASEPPRFMVVVDVWCGHYCKLRKQCSPRMDSNMTSPVVLSLEHLP